MSLDQMFLPVPHVSDTAWLVAELRAIESERPDAHFHDPLARKLLGDKGAKILEIFSDNFSDDFLMSVRAKVIDDLILKTVNDGADMVINLATGLDTRPYRLDLPKNLRWIEVDYSELIDFKNDRLASDKPNCDLSRYGVDLAVDHDRRRFFDEIACETKNCLVLTEGLLYYLTAQNITALAADLFAKENFKWWMMDIMDPGFRKWMMEKFPAKKSEEKGTEFHFIAEDMLDSITSSGWKKSEFYSYASEAKRLNRLPSVPWPESLLAVQEKSRIVLFKH